MIFRSKPKYDEPIRAWKLAYLAETDAGWSLHGVATATFYELKDKAICLAGTRYHELGRHPIPTEKCSCGFYSWKTREQALEQQREWQMIGQDLFSHRYGNYRALLEVDLWGKVIVCKYGYRAEWQRVLAIWSMGAGGRLHNEGVRSGDIIIPIRPLPH